MSQIFLKRHFENSFWFWQTSVSPTTSSNLCRFSSHLHFDCSHSQVTWLRWVISSYLCTSCDGVSCLHLPVVCTCDWPIHWRFGSNFWGQRHICTHIVGHIGWHFFLQPILRVVTERITAHFPRLTSCSYLSTRILTQLACAESTVTFLRSLQYGSKFGLRPLFAYQDQTRGRVLV